MLGSDAAPVLVIKSCCRVVRRSLDPIAQLVSMESGTGLRNNEVRSVMLHGVPIVALVMDNLERLCLAQISNTLLKNFSYNEIHNR